MNPNSHPTGSEPALEPGSCSRCGTPRTGTELFCEGCGRRYDPPGGEPPPAPTWEIEVLTDRDYYERSGAGDVAFPDALTSRLVPLTEHEMCIGRRSAQRGIDPDIDLAITPEDPAVSHRHALLIRQPDGTYQVCDLGSTNGTRINDDAPMEANTFRRLVDGDRLHLGAWTTLVLRRSAESDCPVPPASPTMTSADAGPVP